MASIPLSNVLNDTNTAFNMETLRTQDYADRNIGYTRYGEQIAADRINKVSIQFQYNISDYDVATTISGTGTTAHENNMAVVKTGTGIGTAKLESHRSIPHYPGHECHAVFDAKFIEPDANVNMHVGPVNGDGFWFGYQGTQFGLGIRKDGVDTFVAQSSWNGEQLLTGDFILDPTKLNLFKVTWGWGVVPTTFEVLSADNNWQLVHVLSKNNVETEPSIANPFLPLSMEVESTGAVATEAELSCSSLSGGTTTNFEQQFASERYYSISEINKSIPANTPTNLITVRNPSTWQGKDNHISSQLIYLSLSSDGGKAVNFYWKRNATVGGTPSFTEVSPTSSPIQYDVDGTTVTGGDLSWGVTVAKDAHEVVDSTRLYSVLVPGVDSTLVAESTQAADCTVFLRAKDLF